MSHTRAKEAARAAIARGEFGSGRQLMGIKIGAIAKLPRFAKLSEEARRFSARKEKRTTPRRGLFAAPFRTPGQIKTIAALSPLTAIRTQQKAKRLARKPSGMIAFLQARAIQSGTAGSRIFKRSALGSITATQPFVKKIGGAAMALPIIGGAALAGRAAFAAIGRSAAKFAPSLLQRPGVGKVAAFVAAGLASGALFEVGGRIFDRVTGKEVKKSGRRKTGLLNKNAMKTIRKAHRLKKQVRKAAQKLGMTVTTRRRTVSSGVITRSEAERALRN